MKIYFFPGPTVDLRKLVLVQLAIWVHFKDFYVWRSTEYFDDLNELIYITVAAKDGL